MKLALKWCVPITLAAQGLAWLSGQVALLLGFELPAPQPLVQFFTNPGIAWQKKAGLGALVLLGAPIYEEIIFRMGLFNFLCWARKKYDACRRHGEAVTRKGFPFAAAILSGVVFAAVHKHVATFVPLLFLGVAFAWLYWKSSTIRSSILCHFVFNLINIVLCLFFVEE